MVLGPSTPSEGLAAEFTCGNSHRLLQFKPSLARSIRDILLLMVGCSAMMEAHHFAVCLLALASWRVGFRRSLAAAGMSLFDEQAHACLLGSGRNFGRKSWVMNRSIIFCFRSPQNGLITPFTHPQPACLNIIVGTSLAHRTATWQA
jgi:hypothetical protein